jgi:hypothetical protein
VHAPLIVRARILRADFTSRPAIGTAPDVDGHCAFERELARLRRARSVREELAHVAGDRGGDDVTRSEEARRRGVQDELAHADAPLSVQDSAEEPEIEELRDTVIVTRGDLDAAGGRVLEQLHIVLEHLRALVPVPCILRIVPAHGVLRLVGGDDHALRLRADFLPVPLRDRTWGVVA